MEGLDEEQSPNVMEILLNNESQLSHELTDAEKSDPETQLSLITLAKEESMSGAEEEGEDSKLHIAGITDSIQAQETMMQPVMQVLQSGNNQTLTLPDGQLLQTITLPSDGKLESIHLEDGSTAIMQLTPNEGMLEGQVIQLEDGSTGFIQTAPPDGLQAIQLEDGTTAYLQTNLLGDTTTVSISLDQLQQQVIGVESGMPVGAGSMMMPVMQVATPTGAASELSGAIISQGQLLPTSSGPPIFVSPDQTGVEGVSMPSQAMTSVPNSMTVVSRMPSEKALALGDKAFRCGYPGCGRLYTTQHHLKVHERSHTGDRPFRCDFRGCGKAFATGYGLKSHIRVHTGEKPYRCPEELCTKAFKTSGDLQKHVRIHTGERPFKCPFEGCERSFTTSNIRKVHIRTHTGERPYICMEDGCSKSFASATNYKNHIRIHTGEKPYVCTVHGCGKRFTEYSSLYKHHVVHTHSKPYICNSCGKTYRQTSTLAIHKRTVHGEDVGMDVDGNLINAVVATGMIGEEELKKAMPDMGTSLEEGDGALIINTSDAQQITTVSQDGDMAEGAVDVLGSLGGVQQLMSSSAMPQVYFVTNPAQVQALRDQLQQQQDLSDDNCPPTVSLTLEEVPPDAHPTDPTEQITTDLV